MQEEKRQLKELAIVEAAERVFGVRGFKNAKMEDIAADAGITKVTLYSYFQSKENLYMAITYKALALLIEEYHKVIDRTQTSNGKQVVLAFTRAFMEFCERHYLYSEALLDYFSMIRSTSSGVDQSKLTDAMKESQYYLKLQEIHNTPFKLTIKAIERGIADRSIHSSIDPALQTIQGWSTIIGYVKLISASGDHAAPLLKVSLQQLKEYHLAIADNLLEQGVGVLV